MNINNLTENLSEEEKKMVLNILGEISSSGESDSLINLLHEDYEEIPVDIETFMHDRAYLGNGLINAEGKFTVFPYWVDVLKKIFPDPLKPAAYNTLALTGAIGLGKSTIMVISGLYELYRMLCLKDPYMYYGLQQIDLITFALINITMDAAKGVAWNKMQGLIQSSPWFMARGTVNKSSANPEWIPPKGIELIYGSKPSHIIGRALFWCLDGDTEILTTNGDYKIKDLVGKEFKVYNIDNNGNIIESSMCTAKPTANQKEEIQIELEDGSVIKCTPEHRFMLKDGSYKQAQYLKSNETLYPDVKVLTSNTIILNEPKQYYDIIEAKPYNNFLIKTNTGYVCSHNCGQDEVSFRQNIDVEKQKEAASELVNSASARMQSRFMKGTKNPTLLVLASSKRTEQSFLETWIAAKLKNESKTTFVVDEPQWIIRTDKDSSVKFKVAIGNKFMPSEVLPKDSTEEEVQNYIARGYRLIDVPIGYYENFIDDIDIALTDIAGISTTSISSYISGERLNQAKTSEIENPFRMDVIEVGNSPDDTAQYKDFFDLDKVPVSMLKKPLFIHLDMSLTGDKTGIGGVWIKEKSAEKNELIYQYAFSVSVKAPRGFQVSFEKTRNFIYWLKSQGFCIKGISSDTYARSGVEQDLLAKGYNYSIISVDRVNNDKICLPYQYLKSAIYENRLILPKKGINLLTEELIGLERNNNSGKVDHSPASINCFTGDTKIALTDGRALSFIELLEEQSQGKQNYVYSINHETKKIEAKPIKKVWCSGVSNKILKITLDNGEAVECTPEHKFMLRHGEYCEAQNLVPGDSLMPIYRKYPIGTPKITDIEAIDKQVEVYDMEIQDNHNFALDAGVFVHNSKDQSDGLCLHPDTEIFLLSGKHKTIKQLYDEGNSLDEWVLSYNTELDRIEPVKIHDVVNNGYKEKLLKLTLDNGQELVCTEDHKILTYENSYLEAQFLLNINLKTLDNSKCKVIKIEEVEGCEVYDIRLDKIHNFALTSGIFVHNCGALYNASQHSEWFSYSYGDTLETFVNFNEDEQPLINDEEMIKNLHTPTSYNDMNLPEPIDYFGSMNGIII